MEEIYLIMANRKDGKMPSVAKALHSVIYYNRKDAQKDADLSNRIYDGKPFGVYKAVIVVTEKTK